MLGIVAFNQQAVEGAILQMVNHGISTGALFLLVGMVYERTHTRQIAEHRSQRPDSEHEQKGCR